jgi:hypothetical protein
MVDFISLEEGRKEKTSASSATLVMIMFTKQDLGLPLCKIENKHEKGTPKTSSCDNSD